MAAAPLRIGRPTWAEVDLGAMVRNYQTLAALSAPAASSSSFPSRLIPVLKADAYGHGAPAAAGALSRAGAQIFAVAICEEALALRSAGISQPILVLEGAWPGQEHEIISGNLIPAIQSVEAIGRLDRAAKALRAEVSAHLKIDTGMTRLGIRWEEIDRAVRLLSEARNVRITGTFTHLASADECDQEFSREQIGRFQAAVVEMRSSRLDPGELHVANSAGLLYLPELRFWTVRPGIALYGYPPLPERCPIRLELALTLKSRIVRIQNIAAGETVGYSRRFVAKRPTRAATIPIGYADGYRRDLSGKAKVIVRDRWAPLLGTVSMDLIVVDITDIPQSELDDEVILLGASQSCRMDAFTWSDLAGTIPYEILCGIGSRVPRVHIQTGPCEHSARR